jgi:rhamnulokinase
VLFLFERKSETEQWRARDAGAPNASELIMAKKNWTALAVDLGASSGRVIAARYDGERISLEEMHRFENNPVQLPTALHWDILNIYHQIKLGIRAGREKHSSIDSFGIDSWAIDFGLLDRAGNLLGNPVCYRDPRTNGMMEKVFSIVPKSDVFAATGIQFLQFNTIYQLAAMRMAEHPHLSQADTLLLIPDLLAYFLTGVKSTEFTNATTTQLLDAKTGTWSKKLIEALKLPPNIFKPITQPCTKLGTFSQSVADELSCGKLPLIAVATHDTGSAVLGTPAQSSPFAYISCGTWSLLGTEVKNAVVSPKALELNFTNEGGVCGTYRLLKNIMGLWLLQETKREWERTGKRLSWAEITALTSKAPAFKSFIDPDDDRFLPQGDMPSRTRAFCTETKQPVPDSDAAVLRCITESLALKYRWVLSRLEELIGTKLPALHMIGGGIQNELLCQWTANACGRPVLAGPAEATALGNVAAQLMAAGEVASLSEARALLSRSTKPVVYEPQDTKEWDDAYARFCKVVK